MLQNKEIRRGDDVDLTFVLDGDYSSDVFSFVVKVDKTLTTPRQIEKSSSDVSELERSYSPALDKTTITVHILQSDTQGLSTLDYYYDLYNDTDNETPVHGRFFILADVQSPYDAGTAPSEDSLAVTFLSGTTAERIAYGLTLGVGDAWKYQWGDTDDNAPYWWNGTEWV